MIWKREPVLLMGVIQTALGLLIAFGLHLSVEQIGALLATTAAVLSFLTRRLVEPTATTATIPAPQPAEVHAMPAA